MLPRLSECQDYLNYFVRGQEESNQQLSIAFFKYLLKLLLPDDIKGDHKASTILMMGGTGSGKSFSVETLITYAQQYFNEDIAVAHINAKSITQEGWSGSDLKTEIKNNLPSNTRQAIIFVDEFDKLCGSNISSGGDCVNKHIQSGLLKYIEGFPIELDAKNCKLDTKRCMFIFAGAFSQMKTDTTRESGFNKEQTNKELDFIDAFIQYGMLPEIAGRIQQTIKLNDITWETYCEIINQEDFIYKKYQNMFKELDIHFDLKTYELVEKAVKRKLGVRGLVQLVEEEVNKKVQENIFKMDLNLLQKVDSRMDQNLSFRHLYRSR